MESQSRGWPKLKALRSPVKPTKVQQTQLQKTPQPHRFPTTEQKTTSEEKQTEVNGNALMSKRSFLGLLSALLPAAGPACGGKCGVFT